MYSNDSGVGETKEFGLGTDCGVSMLIFASLLAPSKRGGGLSEDECTFSLLALYT